MRVLSFIPAFLLAAASFVAAAPTDVPMNNSCAPTGSPTDDGALGPIVNHFHNATDLLNPVLQNIQDLPISCSATDIISLVGKVNAILSFLVGQIQGAIKVDLSLVFVDGLLEAVFAHLAMLLCIIGALAKLCLSLHADILLSIEATLGALFDVVGQLLTCIGLYVNANISVVLGPLCASVAVAVELCRSIAVASV